MIDTNTSLNFIDGFSNHGDRKEVIECFTLGYCFWFAYILHGRFSSETKCAIMYDDIENHFGCRIDNKVYDITGDVTNQYDWVEWTSIKDKDINHWKHIIRDCVKKEERKE